MMSNVSSLCPSLQMKLAQRICHAFPTDSLQVYW